MAKAWMPFYVADYLGDTGHLDHEEHGIYILAILHYWQTGKPLPSSAKQLQSICRCFASDKFEQLWSNVSAFFELTPEGWRHDRVESELAKSAQLSEKRKESGKKGGKSTQANAKQLLPQLPEQLPTQSQSQSQSQSEEEAKDLSASLDAASFILTKKKRKLTGKRMETFLQFWEAFGYKSGKAEAADSWLDIPELTSSLGEKIVESAKAEADRRPGLVSAGKTPKMAQGWLTARRWEDEGGNCDNRIITNKRTDGKQRPDFSDELTLEFCG